MKTKIHPFFFLLSTLIFASISCRTMSGTLKTESPAKATRVPMALIPAGIFEMGTDTVKAFVECEELSPGVNCNPDDFTDEQPIRSITLDAFYMDVYEVTNARYAECVDSGKCSASPKIGSYSRLSYYVNLKYADYPVIWISWNDATNYCTWRGARLPTEAEWEYAARGGLAGKIYPWGDIFNGNLVNFCDTNCIGDWKNTDYDDGFSDTSPVGSYPPNGYGLYDLHCGVSV